jgi:preprotein translocase subunit SecE
MSTKKTSNSTDNAIVRFGKGVVNFFKRIGAGFMNVRQELKRVIWPTREKLIQTSAVVLVVIVIAAVSLFLISTGARTLLDKIGFYDQKLASETTILPETGETTAGSADVTDATDAPVETVDGTTDTTEAE